MGGGLYQWLLDTVGVSREAGGGGLGVSKGGVGVSKWEDPGIRRGIDVPHRDARDAVRAAHDRARGGHGRVNGGKEEGGEGRRMERGNMEMVLIEDGEIGLEM